MYPHLVVAFVEHFIGSPEATENLVTCVAQSKPSLYTILLLVPTPQQVGRETRTAAEATAESDANIQKWPYTVYYHSTHRTLSKKLNRIANCSPAAKNS